ncbi:GNAT family N-acetyltransferase [Nonomuraea sp. NPDC049400]|uniref:GNAT family N-acetyltransferase n=1 Tax=Nonomuraea sp. NPDC049400 TaxID=3364352 RepID=UPI0037BAEF8E
MIHPYDRHDGPGIAPLSAQIIDLYQRCYAAPPWSETPEQLGAYPAKLAASAALPGFSALTTSDHTGRLTGVCYGWPTPADLTGNRIYDALITAFGLPATTELTRGAFEVAELFVHPDHQGQGIASHLLTRMTAGWPTAWLITSPHAPAASLYRKLGWRELGPLPDDFYPQLRASVFTRA